MPEPPGRYTLAAKFPKKNPPNGFAEIADPESRLQDRQLNAIAARRGEGTRRLVHDEDFRLIRPSRDTASGAGHLLACAASDGLSD